MHKNTKGKIGKYNFICIYIYKHKCYNADLKYNIEYVLSKFSTNFIFYSTHIRLKNDLN